LYSSPRSSPCGGAGARRRHAPTRRRTTRPWHASCTPCKGVKEVKNFIGCAQVAMRSRWPEVTSGSSTSFQARAAHFRLSPDSGHIAASHRSTTNRLTREARRTQWSSAPAPPLAWGSRCTPTCCGTPAASSSPMTGSIPDRCRRTLGTAISRIRPDIRRWRRGGLRTSGGINFHPWIVVDHLVPLRVLGQRGR
jgi:hypothetical protein